MAFGNVWTNVWLEHFWTTLVENVDIERTRTLEKHFLKMTPLVHTSTFLFILQLRMLN